jgi:multicomponent Na+:H+ antiporter subunit E
MRFILVLWLTGLWVVLWRDVSLANLLSGVAVAVLVTTLFPGRPVHRREHQVRLGPLLAFLAYFLWKLLESNIVLAREVLSPRDRIRTGIVAVPVSGSDLVTTIVANAISLTPGTLTLDIRSDPRTLYVHVLHLDDIEDVRRDIQRLESLVLRAFAAERPEVGST